MDNRVPPNPWVVKTVEFLADYQGEATEHQYQAEDGSNLDDPIRHRTPISFKKGEKFTAVVLYDQKDELWHLEIDSFGDYGVGHVNGIPKNVLTLAD